MSGDSHRIASATGVDVQLAIAGPGSRSYAFIVDWHIRLLLALAWLAAALLVRGRLFTGPTKSSTAFLLAATLPPALVYFLYHPVLEVLMHGRTPGKRMAGVRIVTRLGGTPPVGALLIRNVFRLIDMLPALYFVGLVTTLLTAQRVRIGDLAAGTLLVHDGSDEVQALSRLGALSAGSALDTPAIAVTSELLGRWPQLAPERRRALALNLLQRIHPGSDRAQLSALDEEALHGRLEAALRGSPVS